MYEISKPFENTFSSVTDFFKFASEQLITRDHNFGFRGHSDATWQLEPTLTRFIDEIQSAYQNGQRDRDLIHRMAVRKLHETFKKNLLINSDLSQDRIEKIDLWQYGQHFGLPSPLLDWSHSPYVALFFALQRRGPIEGSLRCVWVLNVDLLNELNRAVVSEIRPRFKDTIKGEELLNEQFPVMDVVQEANQANRRIAFQQGFFTKHEYYRSLEVWVNRISPELNFTRASMPLMQKYSFKCQESERLLVLDKLDKMNINNRTLFPDIFGSVRDAVDSTFRSFQSPRFRQFSYSR